MPLFGRHWKSLISYLVEQDALENDSDYQAALREVDEFLGNLVPSSIGRTSDSQSEKRSSTLLGTIDPTMKFYGCIDSKANLPVQGRIGEKETCIDSGWTVLGD